MDAKDAINVAAVEQMAPKKPGSKTSRYALFSTGVFFAQLGGNALNVLLPIWILTLIHKSPTSLAVVLFVFALFDTLGTFAGGFVLRRISCSRMVLYASLVRFVTAFIFAALYSAGMLPGNLWVWLCGLFAADSLAKGIADTGRYTMPLELVDDPRLQLQKVNGILQSFFELGAVIGPVLVGLMFVFGQAEIAAWLLAFLFAGSSVFFFLLYRQSDGLSAASTKQTTDLKNSTKQATLRPPQNTMGLKVLLALQGLLTIYPMRALLPAIFAVEVFGSAELTAWFAAALGLGGVFGSKFYAWVGNKLEMRYQIQLAGISLGLLSTVLVSKSLPLHFAGYFVFMFFNTSARLAILSEVQLVSTMAISQLRLVANSSSMAVKIGLGALLAIPGGLFWSTGFLAMCGGLQIIGSYLTEESSMKRPSKEGLQWGN